MKLTKAQMETLVDVERGGAIGSIYESHYPPIKKLLAAGLVDERTSTFGTTYYAITDAGLARLALSGGSDDTR